MKPKSRPLYDCCPDFKAPTDKERLAWIGKQVKMTWAPCSQSCVEKYGHDKYDGEYQFGERYTYHVGPLERAVDAFIHDEYHEWAKGAL